MKWLVLGVVLSLTACQGGGSAERVVDAERPFDAGPDASDAQLDAALADAALADARTVDATPADATVAADAAPVERERAVVLPLGETLFFGGDDYLWFWADDTATPVVVLEKPAGALAEIMGENQHLRLSPDVAGPWRLQRGDEVIQVEVRSDFLSPDTFVNYNYSPTEPLVQVGPDSAWVTAAPSNALHEVILDAEGGRAGRLVPVGGWPVAAVSWAAEGLILVAQAGRDSIGFVDPARGVLVDALHVGDEPMGLVLDETRPESPRLYVALAGENAMISLDLATRTVVGRVEVGREPRAMAFDAERGRLYVASLLSSNAHPRASQPPMPGAEPKDIVVIDTEAFTQRMVVPEVGTILRGLWLDPRDPDRLLVALSHARNDRAGVDADSRPHQHVLAEIRFENNRFTINDRVLDRTAASPFTLATLPDRSALVATLSAGKGLLLLNPETLERIARVSTGSDPRGLLVAQGRLWTYAWLSNQVQSWPLGSLNRGTRRVDLEVGRDPTPAEIKAGQRTFNDADFSRNGDFSCNNCHVDGLTDGLVWNILLDGDVNTISFRNVGGTGPFLWGGVLPTLFDFSREVLRLVGAEATGTQMEQLTLYMQSVTAPPNPFTRPGGRLTEAGERGRVLFETTAGCGTCHAGPLLTNGQVVDGKTPLLTDVPSLIATYDSGPWGREAQWLTLDAMVRFGVQYTQAELTEPQMVDLIEYVKQLPGDRIYLTSASPLHQSRAVWPLTPIELTFSELIGEDQLDRFAMRIERDGAWVPLEGRWRISGRYARFERGGEALPEETRFRITIADGLTSTLGRRFEGTQHILFTTGRPPETDVSGRFDVDVNTPIGGGTIDVAFIQARGGLVSGVLLDGGGIIDIDHVEGAVSGLTLTIESFPVQSIAGNIQVESATLELVDTDGDGFADAGEGAFHTSVGELPITARRTALPQQ
jgi:hypothetical protein